MYFNKYYPQLCPYCLGGRDWGNVCPCNDKQMTPTKEPAEKKLPKLSRQLVTVAGEIPVAQPTGLLSLFTASQSPTGTSQMYQLH